MEEPENTFSSFVSKLRQQLKRGWRAFRRTLSRLKTNFLTGFTKWIDPKLARYRKAPAPAYLPTSEAAPKPNPKAGVNSNQKPDLAPTEALAAPEKPYTPKTTEDFLALMKRTPRSVLNSRERHVIATIMNFPSVRVSEIMLPPSSITYVRDDEILGPLTLDRLYHSGFQHFPVINYDRRIVGLIHTTALNSLEIKQTNRASEILDPKVFYLREDYTLNQALAAFLRTNCYFFLVVDRYERIVGMLTYQMLIDFLLGETPTDDFDRDADRLAVAKRKL